MADAAPGTLSAETLRSLLRVYVDPKRTSKKSAADVPPILGSHSVEEGALLFTPRFPLRQGLRYLVVFHPPGSENALSRTFLIPQARRESAAFVERVYPSASRLPENQLKFYLHFSGPMSRGEAYRRVHLLDDTGARVSVPFLELEQELWDREGKRLTIFFDPGRVKRGLVPHDEEGLPLEAGISYTLVIDREWPDADGFPLERSFEKAFAVGPPDHEPPSLADWRLQTPGAGTREPLRVDFPEPLDHGLLGRVVRVSTPAGHPLEGAIAIGPEERQWQFTPLRAWKAGSYHLEVGTVLEDLAGNTIERPFEVDVFERVEERVLEVTKSIRFEVK
jgi:hypothetical protein